MGYNNYQIEFINDVFELLKNNHLQNMVENITRMSPYSQNINDFVFDVKEIELYKELQLVESFVTRPVLLSEKIDINFIGPTGQTNLERMLIGYPPFDHLTNSSYMLHHIGQKYESPFAELSYQFHFSDHYSDLHKSRESSWRNDENQNNLTKKEFREHWMKRGRSYAEQS